MAINVNRSELAGNLGNDSEARYSATGMKVVTASIAVHSSYKPGEEWKERTDWFRLVAFGEAGEALSRFGKGERIRVLGRLQSSEYTDREGQRRTSVEVVVLRSDPAPLTRRSPAADEPQPPVEEAAEEPPSEAEAPEQPAVSEAGAQRLQPAPKPRRRKMAWAVSDEEKAPIRQLLSSGATLQLGITSRTQGTLELTAPPLPAALRPQLTTPYLPVSAA